MAPEWAIVRVSLVITFAVYTLEGVGHGSPCLVSRQGGLVLGLALQHQPKWQWCLDLCGPLHLTHLEPWKQHAKVVWPHFQQFLHWGMPRFILASLIVATKFPILKLRLMILLAADLFCESYMSIQTIAMSDFGETLHTCGLEAILMSLKMWEALIIFSMTLESIRVLVFSMRYGIPRILRYNLDWGRWASWMLLMSEPNEFLM